MNSGNLKPLMSASAMSAGGVFPSGPYILYVTGDGVNFDRLQKVVGTVPNFVLSPFCWLVMLSAQQAAQFSDAASFALPMEEGRAELLLCHLAKTAVLHGNAGGLGLAEWLKKHGYLPA